jgi:hypothetical protein
LICWVDLAFDINGRFFRFEEKFPDTPYAETVIRCFSGSGNLDCILMDDVFVLFSIASLIGHIPAKGFKEGVDEFSSKLGLVVGRTSVGLDITLEAFNKVRISVLKLVSWSFQSIHEDISFMRFVIPGLTKPAPYLIRGNPVFFWIPAFAVMTPFAAINVVVYKKKNFPKFFLFVIFLLPALTLEASLYKRTPSGLQATEALVLRAF